MSKAKAKLAKVIETISEECDIIPTKILSRCSETETVDARWICVKLLNESGYYPKRIAELLGVTPRYVQYILTDFDNRISYNRIMRNNYEKVRNNMRI